MSTSKSKRRKKSNSTAFNMARSIKKFSAGKRGDKIRSDCFVEIELKMRGGVRLDLRSKVKAMYGDSIEALVREICDFFEIAHAHISIEDSGALPFVIAARLEAAVKELLPEINREFLLPMHKKAIVKTSKERLRRSRLYVPGNEPKFFINAGLHQPDGIILDLEDSVAPADKDAARILVRNALRSVDFHDAERMVRINQGQKGIDDLAFVVPHDVQVILIPKCESVEQVGHVEDEVIRLRELHQVQPAIYFLPIVESALGVINAYSIATASENNCGLAIGLEDYTADLGVHRTEEGRESFFARCMVVNAARAAGLPAFDTVFSDVDDMEGLRQSVVEAKALGFEGKGCIHPRQINIIHDVFAPTRDEIDKAKRIVLAFDEAERRGSGVVAVEGKMIDAPVVKRAHRIIDLAMLNKQLDKSWRHETD